MRRAVPVAARRWWRRPRRGWSRALPSGRRSSRLPALPACHRLSAAFEVVRGPPWAEDQPGRPVFQRVKPSFDAQVSAILARLRQSRIVCSDETGARVKGRNAWEWVFQNDQVCVHVIRNSRAKAVAEEVMAGHKPAIWVSDLYGAQRGHGKAWQICLAHQLRDCQYAIEAGDEIFTPRMKTLLLRAIPQATATEGRHACGLCLGPGASARQGHGLSADKRTRVRKRYGKDRDSLFTFMTERGVPPTNNGPERDIRPSTIFRKVTNGFRSEWGSELYAGVRSTLNTGRHQGRSAFEAIQAAIDGQPLFRPS